MRGPALHVRTLAPSRGSGVPILRKSLDIFGPGMLSARHSSQNEGMALNVPSRVAANCRITPEREAWLNRVPDALEDLERRWSLTLGAPFDGENVSCAWVAPVTLADGTVHKLRFTFTR